MQDMNRQQQQQSGQQQADSSGQSRRRPRPRPPQWKEAVAGAFAGAFSRTAMAPIERIKLISAFPVVLIGGACAVLC